MTPTATISDVANLAGVSIKTVSRVVNREPNVRDKTRDCVNQAIAQLNYRPSMAARGLAGGRSFLVGLLYGDASDSFLVEIQRGILVACRENHYGLALCPSGGDSSDMLKEIFDWIRATQPDGLILSPPLSDNVALVEQLVEHDMKFVSVSSAGVGHGPAVLIDETMAAKQMTEHLIAAGHQKIGFIRGPADHMCSQLRFDGFSQAMAESGIDVDQALVVEGDFHFASGVEAASTLLSAAEAPTAIFASNDDMASGVIYAAHQKNLSIPKDLAVAGFDDTPLSRQFWPGISTVKQPIEQIGRRATEKLMVEISNVRLAQMAGSDEGAALPSKIEILPFDLMLRASTQGLENV